ncbi:MAG: hypothetical protein E2603_17875, partial [Achromobacter sp.]|nr:hypothetical protein [Achromobacter sp.]
MSDARALGVLQRVFGYESFRGDQQAIVEQVIGGGQSPATSLLATPFKVARRSGPLRSDNSSPA